MSKKAEDAKKALQESKSAGESLEILADLRKNDPDTYDEIKNEPGN
ncbi:hypothetical protein ACWEF6_01860 [Amycolatopsis sp. NPDC004772]